MTLLDLQGMEPTMGASDPMHGGRGSQVSLLICETSQLSVTLCTP